MKNTQSTLTDEQMVRRVVFGFIAFVVAILLFVLLILGASNQHDKQVENYNNNTRKVRQEQNIQTYNGNSSTQTIQNNK